MIDVIPKLITINQNQETSYMEVKAVVFELSKSRRGPDGFNELFFKVVGI